MPALKGRSGTLERSGGLSRASPWRPLSPCEWGWTVLRRAETSRDRSRSERACRTYSRWNNRHPSWICSARTTH